MSISIPYWDDSSSPDPVTRNSAENESEDSQELEDRIAAVKAAARAEGFAAGRQAEISEFSSTVVNDLNATLNRAVVVGSDSRGYKSGVIVAKSIVERIARTF